MANVKIPDLTAASTPLAGTELLEIVQSSNSRKVAASDIAATATNVRTVATGGTGAATLTGYVKGNGTSAMTASATIPYADMAGRAFIQALSTVDQTGNVSAATAVTFNTGTSGTGINVVSSTQITFTEAGTYMIAPNLQMKNTDAADHDVTIWLRKNGTNIANSGTVFTVPKTGDGGNAFFQIVYYEAVTAGQYIEVMWLPENVAVTIDYIAAGAIAPAIPSAIVCAERIA
jgi:hypothetical protein